MALRTVLWLIGLSICHGDISVNDRCELATQISCGETLVGDTSVATFDGVVSCAATHYAPQLWFVIDAPAGQLEISTCGSITDTILSLYSDGDCSDPSCVAGNDDACGLQSVISIPESGGKYYIMVMAYGSDTGPFQLSATCRHSSDACTDCAPVNQECRNEVTDYATTHGYLHVDIPNCADPSDTADHINAYAAQTGIPSYGCQRSQVPNCNTIVCDSFVPPEAYADLHVLYCPLVNEP